MHGFQDVASLGHAKWFSMVSTGVPRSLHSCPTWVLEGAKVGGALGVGSISDVEGSL